MFTGLGSTETGPAAMFPLGRIAPGTSACPLRVSN